MTIERFHRFKNKGAEQVSYRGPDFNFCPQSLMQSAKEATAPLLDLIDGKSQKLELSVGDRYIETMGVPLLLGVNRHIVC
jgi:hypothetical protein